MRRAIACMSERRRSAAACLESRVSARIDRISGMPSRVTAEDRRTSVSVSPSSLSSWRRWAAAAFCSSTLSLSTWLRTTTMFELFSASLVRYSEWREKSAYFCGSTTQKTTSTRPTRRSDSTRCSTAVESWSGRSRRMSPWRRRWSSPSSADSRHVRLRSGTRSQLRMSCPPSPQTHAVGREVVGLRTPTRAMSRPATALNNDDLPEPVDPAKATTVKSSPRSSRSSALSSRLEASARTSGLILSSSSASAWRIPSASRRISDWAESFTVPPRGGHRQCGGLRTAWWEPLSVVVLGRMGCGSRR
ncbi:Uncharacterised protein [Mycobacteroides abscessus subsp. abscessus]|nr:Uncharacterised protein [Mycobacteroides abscessus subsp. abscessus]